VNFLLGDRFVFAAEAEAKSDAVALSG